jgi:two-component system CitB family response regulator/two-component system response regulator DcuR
MNKISVMIVEDDLKIIEIHKMFIEKIKGFEVVGVSDNIEDAKKMVEILNPDLILLDLFFPKGHGMDLAYDVRTNKQSSDIILITAAQEIESLRNALRVGIFDFIIKPVIFDRFKESLLRYKEHKKKLSENKILNQEFIDTYFVKNSKKFSYEENIPKGIDVVTLKKIKEIFLKPDICGLTAMEVGKMVGASRSTARRYLEYLVSINYLYTDHDYGTVGRPVRKYFKVK